MWPSVGVSVDVVGVQGVVDLVLVRVVLELVAVDVAGAVVDLSAGGVLVVSAHAARGGRVGVELGAGVPELVDMVAVVAVAVVVGTVSVMMLSGVGTIRSVNSRVAPVWLPVQAVVVECTRICRRVEGLSQRLPHTRWCGCIMGQLLELTPQSWLRVSMSRSAVGCRTPQCPGWDLACSLSGRGTLR